jgi:hypothetical protein
MGTNPPRLPTLLVLYQQYLDHQDLARFTTGVA